MENKWSEDEIKEIARQLRTPSGPRGVKAGQMMNLGNQGMIANTVALLNLKNHQSILEIGPGNGVHVKDLMATQEELKYTGLDISVTMVEEATRLNSDAVIKGDVSFIVGDGQKIRFPNYSFDRIFTINTIYFWQDPVAYAKEIFRVLKPGGILAVALVDKNFMVKLPFTKYNFQLYSTEDACALMQSAGFHIKDVVEQVDITVGNMGQPVEREIVILLCKKDLN